MDKAKIIRVGRSQAVRLPKRYRFEGDEVCISKIDDVVILFPRKKGWEVMARGIQRFTDDAFAERDQPARTVECEDQ